jgi:hypothetical protein
VIFKKALGVALKKHRICEKRCISGIDLVNGALLRPWSSYWYNNFLAKKTLT